MNRSIVCLFALLSLILLTAGADAGPRRVLGVRGIRGFGAAVVIDPVTGLPVVTNRAFLAPRVAIDPATGLPVILDNSVDVLPAFRGRAFVRGGRVIRRASAVRGRAGFARRGAGRRPGFRRR